MLIVSSGIVVERANFAIPTTSALLLPPREGRQGLEVITEADPAYIRLWSGANGVDLSGSFPASGSVWDIHIPAGASWPGTVGGVVWPGGLSVIALGTPTGRIAAVGV